MYKNSIATSLNEIDVIGTIILESNTPEGKQNSWIIVEGKDDVKMYRNIFSKPNITYKISNGGCRKVIDILTYFSDKNIKVIGIIDADFSHILNEPKMNSLFLTDYHDIEMMMIYSDDIFRKVYFENMMDEGDCLNVRDKILNILYSLSILKLNNIKNGLRVTFLNSFINFFDFENEFFHVENYLKAVIKHNEQQGKNIDLERLTDNIDIEDSFNLCNGHDFIKALTHVINNKRVSKKGLSHEDLSKDFRLAYNLKEFEKTILYHDLTVWYHECFPDISR